MTQLAERLYTADEFERLQDSEAYELDDGVLKERCVGAESEKVAIQLLIEMELFLRAHDLGEYVPPNTGHRIFANPQRIPRADGGFISKERLPTRRMPRGYLTVAPELVIESVSPGDEAGYLARKVAEYLAAGVRTVWVLYPETRTAMVYRANGSVDLIPANGALDGEDILPGFRCELAAIMPRPVSPEEPTP